VKVIYLKIPKKHRRPHKTPSRAACLRPLPTGRSRDGDSGDWPPKTYESSFIHNDIVQCGKNI